MLESVCKVFSTISRALLSSVCGVSCLKFLVRLSKNVLIKICRLLVSAMEMSPQGRIKMLQKALFITSDVWLLENVVEGAWCRCSTTDGSVISNGGNAFRDRLNSRCAAEWLTCGGSTWPSFKIGMLRSTSCCRFELFSSSFILNQVDHVFRPASSWLWLKIKIICYITKHIINIY